MTDAAIRAAWAEAWRPSPRRSLADWADQHFALPEGDANAGRWRTLGYQRGWLDAISDPTIERVTLMKSARVGYTKACLCVTVAYHIAEDPCAMLIVQPTVEDAEKHSKEDLMPMLRDLRVSAARWRIRSRGTRGRPIRSATRCSRAARCRWWARTARGGSGAHRGGS